MQKNSREQKNLCTRLLHIYVSVCELKNHSLKSKSVWYRRNTLIPKPVPLNLLHDSFKASDVGEHFIVWYPTIFCLVNMMNYISWRISIKSMFSFLQCLDKDIPVFICETFLYTMVSTIKAFLCSTGLSSNTHVFITGVSKNFTFWSTFHWFLLSFHTALYCMTQIMTVLCHLKWVITW